MLAKQMKQRISVSGYCALQKSLKTEKQRKKEVAFPQRKFAIKA